MGFEVPTLRWELEVGITAVLLAQSMGHESPNTTIDHYAGRGAAAQAGINRVIDEMKN
jgi:hypothetical protein